MAALASRPRRHRFATQRLRDARAQTASYTTCRDMNWRMSSEVRLRQLTGAVICS